MNRSGSPTDLTHLDADGRASMVDVGEKPITARVAVAEGFVRIGPDLEAAIAEGTVAKGPVLETARIAGIVAAKRTDELVPLCHTLPLDGIDVDARLESGRVRVEATVRTRGRTGVEMEALVAVGMACLTIVDMGKAIDRAMVVEGIRVLEKHGGRSGSHVADGRRPIAS